MADIDGGCFPPNTLLPSERLLGERFAASRMSIREAVTGLSAMGFVRVEHGRGAVVLHGATTLALSARVMRSALADAEQSELCLIETGVGRITAAIAAHRAGPSEIARLAAPCAAFASAVQSGRFDLVALTRLDAGIHLAMANCANDVSLAALVAALDEALEGARETELRDPSRQVEYVAAHAALLDAIRARDPGRARCAFTPHLGESAP